MTKASNNVGNIEKEYEMETDFLIGVTSFINQDNWNDMNLKVSDFVYLDQSDNQRTMFNQDPKYCITG